MAGARLDTATVGDAVAYGRNRLAGSPTASLDAQLLLGHVLQKPRAWLVAHPEGPVSDREARRYRKLIDRRAAGEPVAYLRGHVEWLDMKLVVGRSVLIPRPETELLVEHAIETAQKVVAKTVVDVGTGSGAIAIALARALPDVQVVGVEISRPALEIAARNVRALAPGRVELVEGDLLEPIISAPDLIVANLPYLSTSMMTTASRDVLSEPRTALYGGESGLEVYERLLLQIAGRSWRAMLLEIDPRQAPGARSLVQRCLAGAAIEVLKDYAGMDRFVRISR